MRAVKVLNAFVVALCIVGVFSFRNSMFDVGIKLLFGVIGYVLNKLEYPTVPLVLGIVLGDTAELALRQSLIISGGSPSVFFDQPIAVVLTSAAILVIVLPALRSVRTRWFPRAIAPDVPPSLP